MNKVRKYSPNVLRIGIALVVMWFGFQQLSNPAMWTDFLPSFVGSLPLTPITFIYLNGWFEVFASTLLMLGVFTRIMSILIAIHLVGIVFSLGYSAIAVRDFGLIVALVSVFIEGEDSWSIDSETYKQNYCK